MNPMAMTVQRMFLVFFVLVISLIVGWYGEKAVEKILVTKNAIETAQNF